MIRHFRPAFLLGIATLAVAGSPSLAAERAFSLTRVLDYPFESELNGADRAPAIAWVRNLRGVRNLWTADGPSFTLRQVTTYSADDGQELTQPTFSPDGHELVFVRGGDHDANWPAEGGLPPDPDSSTATPEVAIWSVPPNGGVAARVAEGDSPAISANGVLAYVKDHQVWTAPLDGKGKPERLFFDRGHDSELTWSPDGSVLAFVSGRGDHSFVGLYRGHNLPLTWLSPSTDSDSSPRWSPDGKRVAFVRQQGDGGAPEPWLVEIPHPWSIWTADAVTGVGTPAWKSPQTPEGSFPDVAGGANLFWGAGERLVFLAELDGWEHLYSVSTDGGVPTLLTPGPFMVEDVALAPARDRVVYSANWGATPGDGERRHLYATPVDAAKATPLTYGETLEWRPVVAGNAVAFIDATAKAPPGIGMVPLDGGVRKSLDDGGAPADFPMAALWSLRW